MVPPRGWRSTLQRGENSPVLSETGTSLLVPAAREEMRQCERETVVSHGAHKGLGWRLAHPASGCSSVPRTAPPGSLLGGVPILSCLERDTVLKGHPLVPQHRRLASGAVQRSGHDRHGSPTRPGPPLDQGCPLLGLPAQHPGGWSATPQGLSSPQPVSGLDSTTWFILGG